MQKRGMHDFHLIEPFERADGDSGEQAALLRQSISLNGKHVDIHLENTCMTLTSPQLIVIRVKPLGKRVGTTVTDANARGS
jgi:hypothetical protein